MAKKTTVEDLTEKIRTDCFCMTCMKNKRCQVFRYKRRKGQKAINIVFPEIIEKNIA